MDATFFGAPEGFRAWLEVHGASAPELWVGFYKRGTSKASITWPEAVDEALCAGWIDGVRKSIDGERYVIRFTPRKPRSTWSTVNVKRVAELAALGRMRPGGMKAFEQRNVERSGLYSYEAATRRLDGAYEARFREQKQAWTFFQEQAPSYRKAASWWVMSAKREETRLQRLARLIDDSANGRRLGHLTRAPNGRVSS